MYAAIDGNPVVVQALLDARANVNAKNKEGQTALKIALDCHNDEAAKLLKRAGAKE
jgi:serine/threonine-protein phosphatase 6 regulatory ankyrin repeat subunit B